MRAERENAEAKTVRAVDRALSILKCFSSEKNQLSLGEISERVSLPKSTVHRIITSLERENFLEQDKPGGDYRLSHEIIRLSAVALETNSLGKIARPEMQWLSDQTQQTSNLYVVKGYHRICIEQVQGPHYVRRYSYLGALLPLYCGASGKVLLAFAKQEFLEGFMQKVELKKFTENTITDKEQLIRDLARIRKQGYAVTLAEREPISASAAAPIFDHSGRNVASLAVSGPVQMFTGSNVEEYIPALLEASKRISIRLGYQP